MPARLRTGPGGLPMLIPDDRESLFLSGASKQRLPSSQTSVLQSFLFSLWIKPGTSGTLRHLISKSQVNANTAADFPCTLRLNTSNQAELLLSNGGDFVADLTLASDDAVTFNAWNYICCAYSSPVGHMWVNGKYKTTSAAVTINSNSLPYTLGNSAADNASAGTDTVIYTGRVFDPRIYNWNGYNFHENAARLMRGEDLRGGLVVEWMPRQAPITPRRAQYAG